MPGALELAVERFRRSLRLREADAVRRLVADYHDIEGAVREELLFVLRELEAAPPAQRLGLLLRRDRLIAIERDIVNELERITGRTYQEILAEQRRAGHTAADDVLDLLNLATGGMADSVGLRFRRLDSAAVEQIVGALQEGSPLRETIDRLPQQAADRFRQETIRGVALGRSPRETARMTSAALGGNLARALTISRTETLRAYRAATLEGYRANSRVVKGWRWSASLDGRTCPVCWAQHGTIRSLQEDFASHPSCRCAMVPVTKTWAEMGLPNLTADQPPPESGTNLFRQQPEEVQLAVLGPAKFAAYQAGVIDLPDLVKPTFSPAWGPGLAERSLASLVGTSAAAGYAAIGRGR